LRGGHIFVWVRIILNLLNSYSIDLDTGSTGQTGPLGVQNFPKAYLSHLKSKSGVLFMNLIYSTKAIQQ
jgi:hypothetical protein